MDTRTPNLWAAHEAVKLQSGTKNTTRVQSSLAITKPRANKSIPCLFNPKMLHDLQSLNNTGTYKSDTC